MGLLAAETKKLTSVRTTWALTLVGLALVAISTAFFAFSGLTGFTGTEGEVAASIDQIGSNSVIVLVVALLAMTTEFRHGTIGRTLQLTPSRTRVLSAKTVVGAGYGVLFFLVGALVVGAVLWVRTLSGDVSLTWGAEATASLWQGVAGLVLTAVLGVAIGALVRSQVLAITVSLVWLFIVENIAAQLVPSFGRWLPFQALNAIFLSEEAMANVPEGMITPLEPLVGLVVFLGYVLVAAVAAVVLMRVRDV